MDLNIVNNEEKFLAGKLEGYTLKGAENKFDDKGNPLLFPGCTIICNIPLNTDLSNEIINYQKKIENFNPKKTYFYLPPSSFHMTLFDCCNFNTKNTNYWPSDIDPDMDYKDIAVELNKRIQNYIFPKEFNLKLKMLEKKDIKTTNVNILLNRVKLDQKKTIIKRLIICSLIILTVSLIGSLAII